MENFRLFEFEDQKWLPDFIRKGMMDYLRFVLNTGNLYKPVVPLILDLLQKTKSDQIVDLCSGGGGAIEQIYKSIESKDHLKVSFILTDLFPNIEAYKFIENRTRSVVSYYPLPVNAASVPSNLKGPRTIFSAFHHFDTLTAKMVIKNAVAANEGLAIFDGGNKNLFFILAIAFLHPLAFIIFTPFLKPFNWTRLFFTYIIPLIPLFTMWDGIISMIRLYTPKQILVIAKSVDDKNYTWQAGKLKNSFGMKITYLVGYPHLNA